MNHSKRPRPTYTVDLSVHDRKSVIFTGLSRMTGKLYALIGNSIIGRTVGGYRHLDGALGGKRRRSRTVSYKRLLVADSAKNSSLSMLVHAILRGIYDMPLRFYGLLALLYSICGAVGWRFAPRFLPFIETEPIHLVTAIIMGVISLCLLTSSDSLSASVSKSHFASVLLTSYLCIPRESLSVRRRKMSFGLVALAVFLGMGLAVLTLFVTPLVMPIAVLILMFGSMILNYPEAGALLVVTALPLVWLLPELMLPLVLLIVMTWASYGLKLLQLRRTAHLDILDIVGLLLLLLTAVSGVGGVLTGTGNARDAVKLIACLSVYFFIMKLLNTRAYIRRCLIGVGIMTVLVMLAGLFLQLEPINLLPFTDEDPIRKLTATVGVSIFDRDSLHRSLLTVMTFPLLYTFLLRAKRLFSRVVSLLLLSLNVYLIAASSSFGTILCTLVVGVLLALLLDHRTLAGGILFLPGTVGAVGWGVTYFKPFSAERLAALSEEQFLREVRMEQIWQSVYTSPLGRGIGAPCEGANLILEVLVCLGWPGLVVSLLFFVLLLQKGLTALSHTAVFSDRALMVGLVCGVIGFLLRGLTYGFLSEPRAILTLTILVALISAFAEVLFEETDIRRAEELNHEGGVDRFYHRL